MMHKQKIVSLTLMGAISVGSCMPAMAMQASNTPIGRSGFGISFGSSLGSSQSNTINISNADKFAALKKELKKAEEELKVAKTTYDQACKTCMSLMENLSNAEKRIAKENFEAKIDRFNENARKTKMELVESWPDSEYKKYLLVILKGKLKPMKYRSEEERYYYAKLDDDLRKNYEGKIYMATNRKIEIAYYKMYDSAEEEYNQAFTKRMIAYKEALDVIKKPGEDYYAQLEKVSEIEHQMSALGDEYKRWLDSYTSITMPTDDALADGNNIGNLCSSQCSRQAISIEDKMAVLSEKLEEAEEELKEAKIEYEKTFKEYEAAYANLDMGEEEWGDIKIKIIKTDTEHGKEAKKIFDDASEAYRAAESKKVSIEHKINAIKCIYRGWFGDMPTMGTRTNSAPTGRNSIGSSQSNTTNISNEDKLAWLREELKDAEEELKAEEIKWSKIDDIYGIAKENVRRARFVYDCATSDLWRNIAQKFYDEGYKMVRKEYDEQIARLHPKDYCRRDEAEEQLNEIKKRLCDVKACQEKILKKEYQRAEIKFEEANKIYEKLREEVIKINHETLSGCGIRNKVENLRWVVYGSPDRCDSEHGGRDCK